jgi:hypothetical protein
MFFVDMHINLSQSVDPEVTREKRLDTRLSTVRSWQLECKTSARIGAIPFSNKMIYCCYQNPHFAF